MPRLPRSDALETAIKDGIYSVLAAIEQYSERVRASEAEWSANRDLTAYEQAWDEAEEAERLIEQRERALDRDQDRLDNWLFSGVEDRIQPWQERIRARYERGDKAVAITGFPGLHPNVRNEAARIVIDGTCQRLLRAFMVAWLGYFNPPTHPIFDWEQGRALRPYTIFSGISADDARWVKEGLKELGFRAEIRRGVELIPVIDGTTDPDLKMRPQQRSQTRSSAVGQSEVA